MILYNSSIGAVSVVRSGLFSYTDHPNCFASDSLWMHTKAFQLNRATLLAYYELFVPYVITLVHYRYLCQGSE